MSSKSKQSDWWQNRIIQHGVAPANSFLAHEMNARRHPAKQREALRGSLDALGWIAPVVVSAKTGKMLDGHARIEEALSRDEMMGVPFVEIEVSEDEERLILATLDPISALATYDKEALESLLAEVSTNDAAINQMLADLSKDHGLPLNNKPGAGGDDYDTTPDEEQTRVEYGDLWACGEHRVLCGDSTKAEDVGKVMAGEKADAVITDPPYGIAFNLDYTRFVGGVSDTQHKTKGTLASDDQPFDPAPYLDYPSVVLWGANCYCSRLPLGSWLVWDKRFDNGAAFLADAEVAWMKGGYGVYIKSITSQGFVRPEKVDHPTQKPVDLFVWAMEKAKAAGLVFDPFGGSGTTLIACERTNRKARLIEIEPKYVNVILSRWEVETGKQAQLLER